jgi:T5SS/PEP-CTERM-associated repeat protein
LTLSAGDKITLEPGTDADPGVASSYAIVAKGAGSSGTLIIDGAGAELLFDPQGNAANLNLGRDSGHAVAVVSNGGAIRMLSSTDLGGAAGLASGGINVGRNGVGTVADLTLNAGVVEIDHLDGAYINVGRNDASGAMTVQNGSTVTLTGARAGSFATLSVGGHHEGASYGDLTVDASDVTLSSGEGRAYLNVGKGAGSIGAASFEHGATLSLTSDDRAAIRLGEDSGAFGVLSFMGGSTVTLNSAKSFIDVGSTAGAVGRLTIAGGSTVTLIADDTNDADVLVGAAFSDFGGRAMGGDGSVLVSGAGSALSLTDSLVVGALGGESTGHLTVTSGGKVTAETVWIGVGGTLDGNGGLILADVMVDGGQVAPGASPGEMTIGGDFSLRLGGMLEMEVDGAGAGEFDVLKITGAVDLSGGTTTFVFAQSFYEGVKADFAMMPLLSSFFPWQDPAALSAFSFLGTVDGETTVSLSFNSLGALSGISGVAPVPLPTALVLSQRSRQTSARGMTGWRPSSSAAWGSTRIPG